MRWPFVRLRVPALWLAPVLGLFFALSFWIPSDGPFHAFAPSDPDDFMRLVEVRSFLQGQGWHDFSVPRLGWGELTIIPWSRLVDLPLAGMALLFSLFIDPSRALELAAAVVPLVLLVLGLLPLSLALARPFVPRTQAWLAPWIVMGCVSPLLFQFIAGRVDHHAYQALFAGWGLAMLLRLLVRPTRCAPGILAALGFSLALWVGGEGFVGLFLFCAALAFWAAWQGGAWLAAGARFGAAFAIFSACVLPLARPVSAWADFSVSWYSGAYVLFALFVGAVFVVGWALGRSTDSRWMRFGLLGALGFFAATLFLRIVPDALGGPYVNFNGYGGEFVLGNVTEAQSYLDIVAKNARWTWGYVKGLIIVGLSFLAPVVAVGACWVGVRSASPRRRRMALTGLGFLLTIFVASFLWQRRVFMFSQIFMVPFATWALGCWLVRIKATQTGRARFWKSWLAFLTLTLLPMYILLPMFEQKPLYPDSVFVYRRAPHRGCVDSALVTALNDPAGLGAKPLRIANILNDGSELLYRTPHLVMSAPYAVVTNEAAVTFLSARKEAVAKKISKLNDIDLVVVCRYVPAFYLEAAPSGEATQPLVQRLVHQKPPAWLKPVTGSWTKDTLVYRVDKAELAR